MKKINKKATLGVGLAMFALADPTQVFNFNNSTLDSTVIKVETQTSYVVPKTASEVSKTIKNCSEEEICYDDTGALISGLAKDKSNVYYFNNGVKVTGLVKVNSDYYYFEEETGKAVTGLVEVDGKTYYFGKDGKKISSKAVKDTETNAYYYFGDNGEMITSKIVNITSTNKGDSGLTDGDYCFGEDGKLVQSGFTLAVGKNDETNTYNTYYVDGKTKQITTKSLVSVESSIYYLDTDGKMVTGVTSITFDSGSQTLNKVKYSSGTYYFNESGEMQTGLINVSKIEDYDDAGIYYFGANGAAVEGWQVIDSNRYYFRTSSDGEKHYTAVVDGEITLNSTETYRFDENGVMITGFYTDDSGTYYYSELAVDLGQRVKGDKEINGSSYTFGEDGKMVTGLSKDGKHYFNNQGQLVTGWITDNGKTYYASLETGEIQTGFQTIDGTKYYFAEKADTKTQVTYGQMLKGVQTINGKNYFLGENTGRVVTGWVTADKDGKNYYMDDDGVIQKSWQTINGSTYYLGTDGAMVTGLQEITTSKITGTYYFGNDGVMRVGFQNVDGANYYFDEKYSVTLGNRGKLLTSGMTEINGENYYLDTKTGKVVTGWLTLGKESVDDIGTTYYMNSRGIVQKGFVTIDGTTYYFNKETGVLGHGLTTIDGEVYFLGENTGRVVTGLITADEKDSDGNRKVFYMNSKGIVQTGFQTIGGTTYYFSEEGYMLRGIQEINGKNYFLGENTGRVVTGWVTADMKDKNGNNMIFYMDEKGIIQTGFQTIDGTTYYFSSGNKSIDSGEKTGQMLKGIQEINKVKYFLGENTGRVVTGWVTADMKDKNGNNMIFYMNSKGIIQTGFQTIVGTTYYFSTGVKGTDSGEQYGQMLKGIQSIIPTGAKKASTYFLGENTGRLVIGWVTADKDGRKYYMNEYGVVTTDKLITIDGKKYYFNKDGQMEVNTAYKTEDGTLYIIDENGVATEQKKA